MAALFFVRHLQLAPQTEPFQWDVAMVAPPTSLEKSTPLTQPMTPPAPAIRPSPSPTKAARPNLQPVEPASRHPVISPTPAAIVEPSLDSHQQHVIPDKPQLSSMTPSPVTDTMADIVPAQPSETLREPSNASLDPPTAPLDSQTPSDPSLTALSSTPHLKSAKADYGWLAETMAQWIKALNKRYPALLRTEGVQGKVTLAAILHEDGTLSDVHIVKSSGHAALDQVAVEDVQNGSPIHLIRPLDRAQMPVKFSISYDLETTR